MNTAAVKEAAVWVKAVAVAPNDLQAVASRQHLRATPGMEHLGAVALGTSARWQRAGGGRYRYTEESILYVWFCRHHWIYMESSMERNTEGFKLGLLVIIG